MTDPTKNPGFGEEASFDSPEDPFACSPDHDSFIRREVAKTLARKKRGEVSYITLDKAMKKFLP